MLAVLVLCSGCFSVRYVAQAAGGQYELLAHARSIRSVRADPQTPEHVRQLLGFVAPIKRWGQRHGLTPTPNYVEYVDLHRSAAVYVVQACAPLSFTTRRWTFPIVGSVPYLGFFDERAAREYAAQLEKEEHLDVTVRTAAAYSTLGWFRDAVLSPMLSDAPDAFGDLANTILHESVHATVYVPDQSAFDESLASFVADRLTWDLVVGREGLDGPGAKAWLDGQARSERFLSELRKAHDDLAALYASTLPDEEKLQRKAARLAGLQRALHLKRPFNNADLAGVKTYDSGTAAFERLRRRCGSWPRFLEAVKTLEPEDFGRAQREHFDDVLDALACGGQPR